MSEGTMDWSGAVPLGNIFSGQEYNVYCDESCHLEHDKSKAMSLGAIWCPKNKVREANRRLIEIKTRHGIPKSSEVKWTKLSTCNVDLYRDIIDYFFDDDDLHFRGLVVPDKTVLDHEAFNQTHELWYYKMYFTMLKTIFDRTAKYSVYIDIKDTHSGENSRKLQEVCSNNAYDFDHRIIQKVQPIRSEEVQLMQLVDILTGSLAYRHNSTERPIGQLSKSKIEITKRIMSRSGYSLAKSTLLSDSKFNLLVWEPRR